jgi:hypothetical protein
MYTDNDIDVAFDNQYDEIPTTNSLLQSTMNHQNEMIRSPEAYSNDSSVFAPMCLQMMAPQQLYSTAWTKVKTKYTQHATSEEFTSAWTGSSIGMSLSNEVTVVTIFLTNFAVFSV